MPSKKNEYIFFQSPLQIDEKDEEAKTTMNNAKIAWEDELERKVCCMNMRNFE